MNVLMGASLQRRLATAGAAALLAGGWGCTSARAEDKSFVSEIAKNNVGVALVYSGPATLPAAQNFQRGVIAANPKRKSAANVLVVPIANFRGAATASMTYVFFLAGSECGEAFSPAIAAALPTDVRTPRETLSVFESRITSDRKNAGAFSIVLYAPDTERFARLHQDFVSRRFGNEFREMGRVSRRVATNKVALFSTPEMRPHVESWGQINSRPRPTHSASPALVAALESRISGGSGGAAEVWNDVMWHDLSERAAMTEQDLAERHEVYFFNRAQPAAVPEAAAPALAALPVRAATVCTSRVDAGGGRSVTVFSAPNLMLLQGHMEQFPNVAAVPNGPQAREAVDLRRVGRTVLLVDGDAPKEEREAVRLLLAREMRQQLGVTVDERGAEFFRTLESEDTLRSLMGESSKARRERARREASSEFVWLFTLSEYSGTTQFSPSETCVTTPPSAFAKMEPSRPSKKRLFGRDRSEEQHQRDLVVYAREHAQWQDEKRRYDDEAAEADYQWRRTLLCSETARARGVLRLVSLSDKGRVVWENQCAGDASNSRTHRSDTISVRGRNGRPSSLASPESLTSCANDLMRQAAFKAGQRGLNVLRADAWLPDGTTPAPEDPASETPQGAAPEGSDEGAGRPLAGVQARGLSAPAIPVFKVASVEGKVAYLTAGTRQGLRFGDIVTVELETRDITDPDTGRLLERKVLDSLQLRVVGGTVTADCVAHTPGDEAKWEKMKAGQSISFQPRKATPPRKPVLRSAPKRASGTAKSAARR